jgi:tight adherence protein C
MLLLAGLVAIAGALGLLGYVVLAARRSVVPVTVDAVEVAIPVPDTQQLSGQLWRRMARVGAAAMPKSYPRRLAHRLEVAGNPVAWPFDRVLAMKGFGLLTGSVLGLLAGGKHGPAIALLLAVAFGAVGLLAPDLIVRNVGEKRQLTLQRQLPDAMDMLTVCVEAGLGFDAALGRVARYLTGPIAEECARVLQEMQFGLSRVEALRSLADRTDLPELRSFVAATVQSSELGISIGDVLREHGKQMRVRRRQRAEERAHKLQVKLLLPLITCLLPAIFVVVLGPAIIHLAQFFSTAK